MDLRSVLALSVLLVLAAGTQPVVAQEADEEEEPTGLGEIFVEAGTWIAQPVGLEFFPVTEANPVNILDTRVLGFPYGTEREPRARIGYKFHRNFGSVVATVYNNDTTVSMTGESPGLFPFGESLVHPLFAGYRNDGRADAFTANARAQLQDVRVHFYRTAFESPRVRAEWFVGLRRVKQKREMSAAYFGLDPDLPALVPPLTSPRPDLDPAPDLATVTSAYSGRGAEAGMDFHLPLWRDRIEVETGFSIAVLRGEVDSTYVSQTNYYVLAVPNTPEVILAPPYAELEDTRLDPISMLPIPLVDDIDQRSLELGFTSNNLSTSSQVVETYLGLRYRAWRTLEVFFGFRNARFTDVGIELKPITVVSPTGVALDANGNLVGLNLDAVEQVKRSVSYEGFYTGLAYRY